MPVVNRFADLHEEITGWRRDFHTHPELMYDVHRTAGIVEDKLREFGCDEVVPGIGRTGVVAVIKGQGDGPVIGMRADMDALPIEEITGAPYASQTPGKMHACGHDGHTAMLLGAAKYLAETRNFAGTAVMIFQPAEEGGAGGLAMVEDGMMDRFGVEQVFGMHNFPGMPVGEFAIRPGPQLASSDEYTILITGKGGHAAKPHMCVDSGLVAAHVVTALQSIVSRNLNPIDALVLSVTSLQTEGDSYNVIPHTAELRGTVRCYTEANRDLAKDRIFAVVENTVAAYGATAKIDWERGYPATYNHPEQAMFAADVAEGIAGEGRVNRNADPMMPAEDFSYMLQARPGAMIMCGNGDSAQCHHPAYDFADEAIPAGCSFWVRLAETAMPIGKDT